MTFSICISRVKALFKTADKPVVLVVISEEPTIIITRAIGVERLSPGLWLLRRFQHTGLDPRGGQFYQFRFEMVQAFADDPVQAGAEGVQDRPFDGLAGRVDAYHHAAIHNTHHIVQVN